MGDPYCTQEPWRSPSAFRKDHWVPLIKKAKIKYRYPYQLRHTFATTAFAAKEPLQWVAKQLGHTNWAFTAKTYDRYLEDLYKDAGNNVDSYWD